MEPLEYNFIKREILSLTSINLDHYKSVQMQRRLKTYLLRSGQKNWKNFFLNVRDDPIALRHLKDYLTINVSSFFRDQDKYDYLKKTILPELLHHRSQLRVWSAGCSQGQEPYSIAMMLAEMTGSHRRHYILATDLDRSALDRAETGGPYPAGDVTNIPVTLLQNYFTTQDGGYWVDENIRRRITFRQHNLLTDPFENEFDLIICRNVVIYFTAPVKEQLYRRFYEALRPGGMFFVGGTEIVSKASDIGFETIGISFYRRHDMKQSIARGRSI